MRSQEEIKMVKRLNATLPDSLALYVGAMTGVKGDYETPSEFIRDLVRRHMENTIEREDREIQTLLMQSIAENDYSPWGEGDLEDARNLLKD